MLVQSEGHLRGGEGMCVCLGWGGIVLLESGTWLTLFTNKKTLPEMEAFATYQSKIQIRTIFQEEKNTQLHLKRENLNGTNQHLKGAM